MIVTKAMSKPVARVMSGTFIALVTIAASQPAAAQDVAAFYRDKAVTIAVGAAAGGGLDTYARLVGRHLGKHIPGQPKVIVSNMPGAGGQVAARNVYAVAPKDGTFLGTFFPSVLIDPLLTSGARVIDPSKFNYVGNAKVEVSICMLRRDAPVKTLEDLMTTEVAIGATSPGSQVVDYPVVARQVLGAKFKVTPGYQGTRELGAAVEKGEVQGLCGVGLSTLKVQYPQLGSPDFFGRIFAQEDTVGDPALNAAGIPLVYSLARTDEQKQVMTLLYAQNQLSRPYVLPPGVPEDRVEAMRKAFMDTTRDPELQADADRMRIDVAGTSGPDMQKLIDQLYGTPTPILAVLGKALGR